MEKSEIPKLDALNIPSLVVQQPYGPRQTPYDFKRFLYRGGADTPRAKVNKFIEAGALGDLLIERLPLVEASYNYYEGLRAAGSPYMTLRTERRCFLAFVKYCDTKNESLSLENMLALYREWVRHLNHRVQRRDLKESAVYGPALCISNLIAHVLGIPAQTIQKSARLKYTTRRDTSVLQKQNLADTNGFVNDLLDVISCISQDSIQGQLPLEIALRSTGESYLQWAGLWRESRVRTLTNPDGSTAFQVKKIRERRAPTTKAVAYERRYALLNLRAIAEVMLFISATSMNVKQVADLTFGDYRFQSHTGTFTVSKYKDRKKSDVEFSIYKDYRPYFERFLKWRKAAYPSNISQRLFFVIPNRGPINEGIRFTSLKEFIERCGRPWINAQQLRTTKGNWIARHTKRNDYAAMALQHDEKTFLRSYKRANFQVAISEWSSFLSVIDPVANATVAAPAPGSCLEPQEPEKHPFVIDDSPTPDCGSPAGCWFCRHFRMIGSFDSVWGALSQRALERLKLATHSRIYKESESPARMVIERINDAVEVFALQSEGHRAWFDQASARVDDEHYHPRWELIIRLAELGGNHDV